jgi:hypothetical protein
VKTQYGPGGITTVAIQTTARTMCEVVNSSTAICELSRWGIWFDGSAAAAGILVELCELSATGTGTAITPKNVDRRSAATFGGTAKYNDTVEPTVANVLEVYEVPPTSMADFWIPNGSEWTFDVSKGFGIRVTGQASNVPKAAPMFRILV